MERLLAGRPKRDLCDHQFVPPSAWPRQGASHADVKLGSVSAMTRIAIEHGLVLTMDRADRVIEDGRVVVEGRDIVAVAMHRGDPRSDCDLVIDATGRIVLPGLVNAHTHLCMVFGRTIGPERRLLEWLDLLMPMMAAMDDEALYVAELLGCIENIKNGNTSLVENIFVPPHVGADPEDAAFRALRDSGIRGTVARATEARLFDPRFCETAVDQARRVERLAARWHGSEGGRLSLSIGPLLPGSWTRTGSGRRAGSRATTAFVSTCTWPSRPNSTT